MKKLIFLLPVVAYLSMQCTSKTHETTMNTLTTEEVNQGWKLLFDGHSMNGWHNFGRDSMEGWKVDSGCMVALGQGGDHGNDIITNDEFQNFELSLEWKISPGGNSGIFFNAVEDTAIHGIYEIAPEYQLIDEKGFPEKLQEWQKAAACYAMYLADSNKVLNPVGEFNVSKIIVKDGHVEHWLNGGKVVEYTMWTPEWDSLKIAGKWKDYPLYGTAHKGHIGLQDHGKQTWFRNIKIRTL
jgi:hypothetical protein